MISFVLHSVRIKSYFKIYLLLNLLSLIDLVHILTNFMILSDSGVEIRLLWNFWLSRILVHSCLSLDCKIDRFLWYKITGILINLFTLGIGNRKKKVVIWLSLLVKLLEVPVPFYFMKSSFTTLFFFPALHKLKRLYILDIHFFLYCVAPCADSSLYAYPLYSIKFHS